MVGDHVEDVPVSLQLAADGHEPGAEQGLALPFSDVLPHHGVYMPGLVLQGHEGDAVSAACRYANS